MQLSKCTEIKDIELDSYISIQMYVAYVPLIFFILFLFLQWMP